ncbi:MAG: glucose-6-phosphate dehydrogenase [Terriglobia bacterium]|jgi:glucose-6-phosphate 1-dehydrogenase
MAGTEVLTNPLREGMRIRRTPDPCAMVIFGASGDLTARKLIPALYYLARERTLPPGFSVVGSSRSQFTHEQFREKMRQALKEHSKVSDEDAPVVESFVNNLYYFPVDTNKSDGYGPLAEFLRTLDREHGTSGNRVFYLATPPSSFPVITEHLGEAGLARPQDPEKNWARIVLEKPFGRDLQSARALNRVVTGVFGEQNVYRIDHYLGKETVQNLLVFRFANGIFEPIWNRRYIDHVQITVAEDLGVENRASYFEEAGLLRDMIQSHVLQVLSLVTMEAPARFEARSLRDEKAKVMRCFRPIAPDQAERFAARGQYIAGFVSGRRVEAYRSEPGVDPASYTETYSALKIFVDNWRWADVPFYIRSGKRLAKRITEISIQFRRVPHLLFGDRVTDAIEPDLLALQIQPDEGISLRFSAKYPGPTMQIRPVKMQFQYGESFGADPPSAYETLLLDCMLGDNSLFTRNDSVELAWEFVDPILARWKNDGRKGLAFYEAGTWGPAEADALIERDGRRWQRL